MADSETHPLVLESIRIAERGESRGQLLEGVGWIFVVLGILFGIGTVAVAASEWGDMDDIGRAQLMLLLPGLFFGYLIVIAVFFGFAALVRNTSRMLLVQSIDSGLNDDEE